MPDLEDMSLDELTAMKTEIKTKVDALHEEARIIADVQNRKIYEEHVERARISMQEWADKNGKTLNEAIEYWEGRLEGDPSTGGGTGRWVQSLLLQGKEGKVVA